MAGKFLKELALGDKVVRISDVATEGQVGLVKIGSGLVVDSEGAVYLKILQDGSLFLPSGETLAQAVTVGGKTYNAGTAVYRAISLVYSDEQKGVVFNISDQAYAWDNETKKYVEVA